MSNTINNNQWDEKELIQRLKKGEEEAFRVLVRQYQSRLYGMIIGIVLEREESRDILQEVFLKVYTAIGSFEGRSGLITWLRRIAINECLNWRRRWKRRFRWKHQSLETEQGSQDMELGNEEYGPETLYQKKRLEKLLMERLNSLPEDARTVFVLRELEGLTYDEIASLLNINKGTVSSRLFHARQRLKQSLATLSEGE